VRRTVIAFLPLGLWAAAVLTVGSIQTGSTSLPPGMDKVAHFVMYGVGGFLAAWAGRVRGAWAGGVGLALVLLTGAADELHQGTLAFRQADVWDWAADAGGAGVFYLLAALLLPTRP
jgi:VanZ family protein